MLYKTKENFSIRSKYKTPTLFLAMSALWVLCVLWFSGNEFRISGYAWICLEQLIRRAIHVIGGVAITLKQFIIFQLHCLHYFGFHRARKKAVQQNTYRWGDNGMISYPSGSHFTLLFVLKPEIKISHELGCAVRLCVVAIGRTSRKVQSSAFNWI